MIVVGASVFCTQTVVDAARSRHVPAAVSQLMRPDFMRSRSAVPNRFELAKNAFLDSRGIESFIDPQIVGRDRRIAHGIMASMLPNLRGDFLYYEPNGHVISNNAALIPYASIEFRRAPAYHNSPKPISRFHRRLTFGMQRAAVSADSSTSCGPPNPPSAPMGAYTRLVSPCGFATGWGFVNVPQGDSYMPVPVGATASPDTGNLYFEIQGPGGNAMEGGLSYYSDSSIAPYLRSSSAGGTGYITMTNNSVRYFAGEILGVFHGITPNPSSTTSPSGSTEAVNLAYTIVGALSSTQDPEDDWVSSQAVDLINPSYLFYNASPDMVGSGVDAAGVLTPCSGCSVSKVTSIAQNGVPKYNFDNSYFGVDDDGDDAIQWLQVAFGEWTSGCQPGAAICPFASSADPIVYYGAQEAYPDSDTASTSLAPTGYGPYESYDGISLESGSDSQIRHAAGGFTEPLPPMPCSPDSDGNCSIQQAVTATSTCNTGFTGPRGEPIIDSASSYRYSIYSGSSTAHYRETAYENQTYSAGSGATKCKLTTTWSPNNPSAQYSDSSLP